MGDLLWNTGDLGFSNGIFLVVAFYLNALAIEAKLCGKSYKLDKTSKKKKIKIDMPPKGPKCFYNIFGDKECNVELSCKVDMPMINEDCDEEFVKVTDGAHAYQKFCGKTTFARIRASPGLRDLFMVIESQGGASTGTYEGIQCLAKCVDEAKSIGNSTETQTQLPTANEAKIDDVEFQEVYADAKERPLSQSLEKKHDIRCVCGMINKDDRIVGGQDAFEHEFPWQAAVVFPKTRSPISGATIINDRYVLTTGHTYAFGAKKNLSAADIEVIIHAHVLDMTKKKDHDKHAEFGQNGSIKGSGWDLDRQTDKDEGTQRFQVEEIISHPLFTKFFDYDYALLRLKKKINFAGADSPVPICLPPADTFDSLMPKFKESMLTVTGWGLHAENAGATTRLLQKVEIPYINFEYCRKYNPNLITRRMLCAGSEEGGKDACAGDSGGPLIYMTPTKQYMQVGIVSWGDGCGRANRPGFYSRVTEMMQWILLHTSEGNARWCKDTIV